MGTSASNVEKKAKKVEILHCSGFSSKGEVQKLIIYASLMRFLNLIRIRKNLMR
jgi:hypothetical protein